MRLQRHITAAHQWKRDLRTTGTEYEGLVGAAAARDDFAYSLLQRIALDTANSLQQDTRAMRSDGNAQRLEFVSSVRRCLPDTVAAFDSQTPAARAACRRLFIAGR
jgi:hypothetical protein